MMISDNDIRQRGTGNNEIFRKMDTVVKTQGNEIGSEGAGQ